MLPPVASAPPEGQREQAGEIDAISDGAPEEPERITILCVGDVMAHSTQYKAQYDSKTKVYNFDDNFQFVAPYITEADLALCNLETVFAGGKPQGYPAFNAPDELADSLKNAGFDVALLSNNHILDQGVKGLQRTLSIAHKVGLETAGAHEKGSRSFSLVYAGDIRVGLVSYTYETPSIGGRRTLNGNYIPESAFPLLNSFSYENLDADLEEIRTSIKDAREAGAEIIVCYFHWGSEYQRSQGKEQERIADEIASAGADIIFGSHPHVVQPVTLLTDELTGRKTAVFFSMGNFISNQRAETLDNKYTEQGVIARVSLSLTRSTGEISDYDASVVPLWVDRYTDGRTRYAIVPLDEDMETNPALKASGHLDRARGALADLTSLIGEEYMH